MEGQRESCGLHVVELGWRVEHARQGREGGLGDATEGLSGHRDYAPPEPLLCAGAGRVHHAADVHAERERHLPLDARERDPAAGDVPEVQRRGRDGDAHLAGPNVGDRDVLDLEGVRGRAMPHDSNCLHAVDVRFR